MSQNPPPNGSNGKEGERGSSPIRPPTREFYAQHEDLRQNLFNIVGDIERIMFAPPDDVRRAFMTGPERELLTRVTQRVFNGPAPTMETLRTQLRDDLVAISQIPIDPDARQTIEQMPIDIDFLKQPAETMWAEFEQRDMYPRTRLEYMRALVSQFLATDGRIAPSFWGIFPTIVEHSGDLIEETDDDRLGLRRGEMSASGQNMSKPQEDFFYFAAWHNMVRACYYALGEEPRSREIFELELPEQQ